ncbi:unnamed protein product, partial [Didymodactylos carnosus]
ETSYILDCVKIKYSVADAQYGTFYKNLLRPKLANFLVEERRREENARIRHELQRKSRRPAPSDEE